jgi:hypothetical protein
VITKRLLLAFVLSLFAVMGVGAIACSGSSSTTALTTTGIVIRAETLTVGRGCGKDPANLFKYAVYVWGYGGAGSLDDEKSFTQLQTSNLFDCFTDGAFIELKAVNGSTKYRLDVFAYNAPAFGLAKNTVENAGDNPSLLETTNPTWTTTCTATQQRDVEALAVCRPLTTGLGGLGKAHPPTSIRLQTGQFRLGDGRVATCAAGLGDAGAPDAGDSGAPSDAGPQDAGDAGDAGDAAVAEAGSPQPVDAGVDAGPPISYSVVRVRYRLGNLVSPAVEVTCPNEYAALVPNEPARYSVDVGFTNSSGAELGQATCTVDTLPGQDALIDTTKCR